MVIEERPPLEEEKTEAGDQDLRRETRENIAWIFGFCILYLVFSILYFFWILGEKRFRFCFGFKRRNL